MIFTNKNLHFLTFLLASLVLVSPTIALNRDGMILLSFKYLILGDPLSALESWNYNDETPCSWNGVTCTQMGNPGTPDMFRVTSLVLPNSQLFGSVSADLGYIEHLKQVDLSNNFLNGSLPNSIFNSTELQVIALSGNEISGDLPESIGGMRSLQVLNLSDNALTGKVPKSLAGLQNLTVLFLRTNYFSGYVPGGFKSLQFLDLSSNLLNGSLPLDFGGYNLLYLNLSYNKLSGPISTAFAIKIPQNATIDLSFNNLTGAIPESSSLLNQKTESFRGNLDLCGKPLKNLCSIPSTLSTPPNVSTTSPAIAVIPKPLQSSNPVANSGSGTQNTSQNQAQKGLKPGTVAAIAIADLAGISLLAIVIFYVYQLRKRKNTSDQDNPPPIIKEKTAAAAAAAPSPPEASTTKVETEPRKQITTCSCLRRKEGEETSEATTSDSDQDDHLNVVTNLSLQCQDIHKQQNGGKLVIVDGETKLELETLLKASAYILGASGPSIIYKAVLVDGTAFAVRRIGDSGLERLKDFETQVRSIAKLRHPNLVQVRGFYWGDDEKLLVCDYVSNGNLANAGSRKSGSSPSYLSLEVRFRIARGAARGLAFIHEKKHVHGNIKPSNILFNQDMEPVISDLGLDRLVYGNHKGSNSARGQFGSQRFSTTTSSQDLPISTSPGVNPSSSTSTASLHYQAPESLKNLKPNPKWDVYSFGIILLELLTGRVFSDRELSQWTTGSMVEDKNRVLRLADVAIRGDVEAKEEAMLACFKLGFSCASFVPQKRPSMKEALQVLEKISSTASN